MSVRIDGRELVLPGLATAHSHAFQRALRGRTHRVAPGASFWSWRDLMYRFVQGLDPSSMLDLAEFAFQELARNGVTAVGEFHYVHHDKDGVPYANRTEMADAVIEAARRVGLRITLLRVLYARAGFGREATGPQARFMDTNLEDALRDAEDLQARYAGDETVRIGLAPHSVRAVPREWIEGATAMANKHGWPLHMHVAEQPREIHECLAEHGRRPVELLRDCGALGPRFVAVHATHLRRHEAIMLGEANAFACICRTTERDLGDGSPDLSALVSRGTRICVGVDSHALSDPFEELRAVELDERIRTGQRQVAMDGSALIRAGSQTAYDAIGHTPDDDEVRLSLDDPSLVSAEHSPGALEDAAVFGATGRAVIASRAGGAGVRLVDAEVQQRFSRTVGRLLG